MKELTDSSTWKVGLRTPSEHNKISLCNSPSLHIQTRVHYVVQGTFPNFALVGYESIIADYGYLPSLIERALAELLLNKKG